MIACFIVCKDIHNGVLKHPVGRVKFIVFCHELFLDQMWQCRSKKKVGNSSSTEATSPGKFLLL